MTNLTFSDNSVKTVNADHSQINRYWQLIHSIEKANAVRQLASKITISKLEVCGEGYSVHYKF